MLAQTGRTVKADFNGNILLVPFLPITTKASHSARITNHKSEK